MYVCTCVSCFLWYSLLQDRVPYGDRQQAVNVVGNRAPLDKQEPSDHHCHTHTQPLQGIAGHLPTQKHDLYSLFWWKESLKGEKKQIRDIIVCLDLSEDAGMSVEASVSLQYHQDNIRGPAYKSQHHTATQEEPVIGMVVDQALQGMGYQRLAQRDLMRGRHMG